MITLAQQSQLTVLYGEPQRHYHNLSHIQHCLRELSGIPGLTEEKRAILEAAIWFHDAVYDPKAAKGVNENASINLMYSANLTGIPVNTVEDLIAATINHQVPADESAATEELMGLFLDIDLSILGQDEDTYDEQYASKVRDEYSWVPIWDYREGRRQVLVSFLARKHIYFSEHFRSKYEAQARANLSREALALIPDRPITIHEPTKG